MSGVALSCLNFSSARWLTILNVSGAISPAYVGEDQGDKECRPGPFVSLYLAGYEPHEGFVGPVFELDPGLYRWGGFPCVELAC